MTYIKKLAIVFTAFALLFTFSLAPAGHVYADSRQDVCDGLAMADSGCTGGEDGITRIVKAAINIISLVAGVAAVIFIIVGGIRYIISGGDSSATAAAKNTIIYALVGLVIVTLAQVIVRFVLGKTQ